MAVYEALCETRSHPTAEELFRVVRPRTEKLSLATVYNALEALCGAGLVRRIPMSNGCCRYDSDTSMHLHVRFRDTYEIEDVPSDLAAQLLDHVPQDVLAEIGRSLGVEIDGVSIQLLATRGTPES
jgi:Fe2+ or Zn2+ uptake regulation protein